MDVNETCPKGREITTRNRCEEAVKYASSLELDANRTVRWSKNAVGWPNMPLQCSVFARVGSGYFGWVHFNQRPNTTNTKLFSGEYVMLCEAGKTFLFLKRPIYYESNQFLGIYNKLCH